MLKDKHNNPIGREAALFYLKGIVIGKDCSQRIVAEKFNVSTNTVRFWVKKIKRIIYECDSEKTFTRYLREMR